MCEKGEGRKCLQLNDFMNALRIFITANDRIIEIEAITLHDTVAEGYSVGILTVEIVQTTKEFSVTGAFQSETHKR